MNSEPIQVMDSGDRFSAAITEVIASDRPTRDMSKRDHMYLQWSAAHPGHGRSVGARMFLKFHRMAIED